MTNHENPQTDFVGCPECGAPAEVTDRFALSSTEGPVEHVKVRCVTGRWFTVPVEKLPVAASRTGEEPQRWTSPLL